MKKIIIALFPLFIMLNLFSVSAFADSSYIYDEVGIISDAGISELNGKAAKYVWSYGIGVYYAYIEGDITEMDVSEYVYDDDFILMAEDEDSWGILVGGTLERYISDEDKLFLRNAYDAEDTYYAGVGAYIDACNDVLMQYVNPVLDIDEDPVADNTRDSLFPEHNPGRLYDGADILNSSEEAALTARLNEVSEKYSVDFVIATVETTGGFDASVFTEEYFDRLSYGIGDTREGVLLLIAMDERDYRILSNGIIGDTIGDLEIDLIGDHIVSSLSYGDYAEAFNRFIDKTEYYVNGAINGFPFNYAGNLILSFAIGLIAALISVSVMKGKLKTVKAQNEANAYVKDGSMKLTQSSERFLYATVSRTARQTSSSRSSSGHRSGGGSRHVGGGKF